MNSNKNNNINNTYGNMVNNNKDVDGDECIYTIVNVIEESMIGIDTWE